MTITRLMLALLIAACTRSAAAQEPVIHRLEIGQNRGGTEDAGTVNTALREASSVLEEDDDGPGDADIACDVSYELGGRILDLPGVAADIQTPDEAETALAQNVDLIIVDAIGWCDGRIGQVMGCSSRRTAIVQKRYDVPAWAAAQVRAITWAHEIGHISGLDHRENPGALMQARSGLDAMFVNEEECGKFRRGPGRPRRVTEEAMADRTIGGAIVAAVAAGAMLSAPYAARGGQGETRVTAFLSQLHHHGIPAAEAAKYATPSDIAELERIVQDPAQTAGFRSKAAEVLGMVGDEGSFAALKAADSISRRDPTPAAALSAMRAIGQLTARRAAAGGFQFLQEAAWSCRPKDEPRCVSRATSAVVGLAMTGRPDAHAALCLITTATAVHDRVRAAARSMLNDVHSSRRCPGRTRR